MIQKMQAERVYRHLVKSGDLVSFEVREKETDLLISADRNLEKEAREEILKNRRILEDYIKDHPYFLKTLQPYRLKGKNPSLIEEMVKVSGLVGVGPMAAVAGLLAEKVGKALLSYSKEVLVENGGDIFIKTDRRRKIGIYTDNANFGENLALEIYPEESPLGICTSSGKLGHSLSFGKADAVITLSSEASLADASATAIANRVKDKDDISKALAWGRTIPGIIGLLIIVEDKIGAWGRVNLVSL